MKRKNSDTIAVSEMDGMPVSLVVMLPLIIVFFFTQRIFIQGVVFTGYK